MASTSNNTGTTHHSSATYGSDPTSPNTTFVQADPSTFRTIVQKLTGAPDDPSTQKLPLTHPNRPNAIPGPKRPAFKLQERRQSAKNLQINLSNYPDNINNFELHDHHPHQQLFQLRQQQRGFLVSPVSTLDFFAVSSSRVSPRSPCEEFCARGSPRETECDEERAIAEKGFYLHPSPLSTPRGAEPPELLPLFPLCSPREVKDEEDHQANVNDCNSCY
ncbi:VQ motif-containing protein 11 [Ricinus communis]|uniref:VQ motif-containing protein 11 n=1 Tax=Ricinus communis TaxID=3988 RepID=UPI0007722081|nr:VQ motif-containing protein 11 [Ricinus communis]|eukprot:XP_015573784.1 VQ motif-containing protein 11 [Ricinus communis]